VQVGGPLSGLAYSADGKFLYALRGDNGYLVKYSTTDFTVADQYLVGVLGSYSSEAYGDQIRFAVNGDTMTVFGGGILKLVKLAPNDDVMPGTAGADSFYGYGGNDTYTVNDAGDQVFEDPGKGTDTVLSSISYALAANVENLVLTGSSALSGTGNPLANVITGNAGASSLSGMGGNDRLLVTASGSGSAVDGGADFDTLVVSGAVSLGSIAAIEALELTAGATLTLTSTQSGTGLPLNAVVSGSGALVINFDPGVSVPTKLYNFTGFTGSITINGSSGVDVMKLGNVAHTANGGDGIDQIKGGSAADTIDGGNGGDKINGAGGADILTGGAGNDVFKYANGSDSGLGAASDRITDFTIGQDRLNFSKIDADAALAGDQAFTFLGTAAFTNTGLGQLRYLTAGADLIVQADVNGDGVADMEVILQGLSGQVLTGADIVL
jgi:Ca2+-binding RTX toxin-like protein